MSKKSIITMVIVVVVGGFLVALAIYNSNQRADGGDDSEAWNSAMVAGKADAPNKIIEYGDYFCEYCTKFHEQAVSDEFQKKYLDTGLVSVETRPVTLLAGPRSPNAEQGAEAAFCAADQDKFEAFSNHIIPRIKNDYFDKGIGVKSYRGMMLASPKPIEKLPQSYFNDSAKVAEMDIPVFEECMKTHKHEAEITKNTQKAVRQGVNGLPHIKVNSYVSSGFGGGWDNFELMLKAGGVKAE